MKNLPNLLMAERAVVGERPSALETGEPPQSERTKLLGINKLFRQVTPTLGHFLARLGPALE